jgi:hypothetical protein
MHRKPYNPATAGPQVHDRRATQVNRGLAAHLAVTEIDDPFEVGARIATVRSVRDDPLADHLARGHIDQAQYQAGRRFQECFRIAECGPRTIQWSERVDASPSSHDGLTNQQQIAWRWLGKCRLRLGDDWRSHGCRRACRTNLRCGVGKVCGRLSVTVRVQVNCSTAGQARSAR